MRKHDAVEEAVTTGAAQRPGDLFGACFSLGGRNNLAKLMSYLLGSAEPLGTWRVWGLPTLRAADEDAKSLYPAVHSAPFLHKAGPSPGSEWSH